MTVPRWAPQNQQAASAGRDATTVGRDQHIQNVFQAKAQGLNISYADFRDAIKEERLDERRTVENHFISQLSIAYEDFTRVQAERDQFASDVSALRRNLALRSSWWFLVLLTVVALAVGGFIGTGIAFARQAQNPTAPAPTVTVTATETVTESAPPVEGTSPGDQNLQPKFALRPCDSGAYVIQLAAVNGDGDVQERDIRAKVLADDLDYRLTTTKRPEEVQVSQGTDYCYGSKSTYAAYVFLWVGPMSKSEANGLCAAYRESGVSADCLVSSPDH